MAETITDPRQRKWAFLHAVYALLLVMFYLYYPANIYLWETLRYGYVFLSMPVAVVFYYYFRGLRDGPEYILVTGYALWFYITRVLNGQIWLDDFFEFHKCIEITLCAVILPAPLLLNGQGRKRLANWFCALTGLYLFVVGLAGVYAVLARRAVLHPVSGIVIAGMAYWGPVTRLNVTDLHPNVTGMMFFVGFFLLMYQFFACRRKLWRIPIVLAAAVDYFIIAFTFSRATMIAFSVCIGMLLILAVRKAFPLRRLWAQILLMVAILAVTVPLCYKSFDLTAGLVNKLEAADRSSEEELSAKSAEAAGPRLLSASEEKEEEGQVYEDQRDLGEDMGSLAGRTDIYKGEWITICQEPIRLLRGALWGDVMTIVNQHIKEPNAHLHNYLLQVLGLTGVPGFLLVLAFSLLLLARMVLVFFSPDPAVEMPVRVLTVLLTGYFIDGMVEIPMFSTTNANAFLFFLIAGLFLAWSYEWYPPKKKFPFIAWRREET